MSLSIVEFWIGPHICALPIGAVQEVLRIAEVTHLPRAPEFVEGTLNLRGHVLPVIDLRRRMGLSPGPFDDATHIIITALHGHTAGLIVDDVIRVGDIDDTHMGIDPAEALGIDMSCVARVVQGEGSLIAVLSPDDILTEEEGRQFTAVVPIAKHDTEKT